MVDEIIAKSHPQKTLKEHIDDVMNAFDNLRKLANKVGINLGEEDWEILKKACFYHDFGKANSVFQKKIRESLNLSDIPHNFLSIFFLQNKNEILLKLVAFHHWRDFPDLREKKIEEIRNDISRYISKLEEYFNKSFNLKKVLEFKKDLEKLQRYYFRRIDGGIDLENESKFVILLGLLNRIDHSASAGVPVEIEPINKYEITKNFLLKKTDKPWQLSELSKVSKDYKNKNGIVIASTGMGKTEMSLLWSNSQKTFYTLPVRTSVTAMFRRLKGLFGKEKVGLLHSDAMSNLFFEERKLSTDDIFYHYDMAKNLSYPLIVSTADQIFTATLKYLGFEKIYATLSYSKVIVDEIQAYSPQTMAIIIHGLKEIASIGGKFLIVTATFPSFVRDELPLDFSITKIPNLKKHNVKLVDEPLAENTIKKLLSKLISNGIGKILIVCNTVEKAQELYKILKEFSPLLLHSRFTRFDRNFKENIVLREDFKGILISTQVIEVSLDIDFDILITEMSPLDVLVQRMGRIYRRFKSDGEFYPSEPNVYIFTKDPSGIGTVYEKEIMEKSKDFLKSGILSEKEKYQMTEEFYSKENIKNTNYWTKFNNALKSVKHYSVNKKTEAQEVFRDISQIEVIPKCLLDQEVQNEEILKKLNLEKDSLRNIIERIRLKDRKEKILFMELIKDFMVPIPLYRIKGNSLSSLSDHVKNDEIKEFLLNIKVVDYKYSNTFGIYME
ncbi:CRISPR-associated helicase/endonuclease Cas3 [Candidatus Kryptobacter tengchongensis]|uniref:CRISPR-associated endonuclease/helicase Cas3 n=1 Tax=Kryptobacter tengchongensis TaxID=1643429 RepID=A0A656D2K7_KRYT1|nr:CRISPR-associated helicase/endonuclease Cas3 [Candidatus Kryptobacter tengchongensis]CUS97961.1 CRISPR-associated endonuclease/helicase Cas3 [Candidatus Kryptobacter tengchongensis]